MTLYIALLIAGPTGYVMNAVKFFKCDFEPSYKAEIIRGIGIVTPFGCVLGYIDLGK